MLQSEGAFDVRYLTVGEENSILHRSLLAKEGFE